MARSQPRKEDYFCNPTVHEICSLGAPYTVIIYHSSHDSRYVPVQVSLNTRIEIASQFGFKISCEFIRILRFGPRPPSPSPTHLPSRKYTTLLRFRVPHQKPLTTHEILRASMPQMHDVLRPTKNQIPQMDVQMLQHQTIRR